jgi:hypothetical protein
VNAPATERGDDFYMRGFWELSSCRIFGEVFGPIPWDKALHYGQHAGLEPDMLEVFLTVVRELDEHYLQWQNEQKQLRVNSG